MRFVLLFYFFFCTVCFGDTEITYIQVKETALDSEELLRTTEFVRNDVRLFLLVENIAPATKEVNYSTEMFFFDGGLVSVWHWNRKEGLSYIENKHDAPVAVRMEDNDADGIIDRVVYSRDDASKDFFSVSPKTFFRHERLGMIPVVDKIQGSDGITYQIDAGSETVSED